MSVPFTPQRTTSTIRGGPTAGGFSTIWIPSRIKTLGILNLFKGFQKPNAETGNGTTWILQKLDEKNIKDKKVHVAQLIVYSCLEREMITLLTEAQYQTMQDILEKKLHVTDAGSAIPALKALANEITQELRSTALSSSVMGRVG